MKSNQALRTKQTQPHDICVHKRNMLDWLVLHGLIVLPIHGNERLRSNAHGPHERQQVIGGSCHHISRPRWKGARWDRNAQRLGHKAGTRVPPSALLAAAPTCSNHAAFCCVAKRSKHKWSKQPKCATVDDPVQIALRTPRLCKNHITEWLTTRNG